MSSHHPPPYPVDPEVLAAIRPMARADVMAVVRLHAAAMGSSLWAQLGPLFLAELYCGLLAQPDFLAYVYQEEGRVRGFIAGSGNAARMFRRTFVRRLPRLGLALVPGLSRKPELAAQLAETFLYFRRSNVPGADAIQAESLFCSFEPDIRGKRVSGLINKVLFDELAARGHRHVKITTEADNAGAVRQMSTWGFERLGHFFFYDKEMVTWRLDLEASPRVEAIHHFPSPQPRSV